MKRASRRSWSCVCVPALLAAGPAAQAALVSLKAVKHNDIDITPTNFLSVSPGDTVIAELWIRDWSQPPPGVGIIEVYQVTINGMTGFYSQAGCGNILPSGWDIPLWPIECETDDDCPEICPVCPFVPGSLCECPGEPPEIGAYVDGGRTQCPDPGDPPCFVHATVDHVSAVDRRGLDYRYGSVVLANGGFLDEGQWLYAGTLKMVVSANAAEEFLISIAEGDDTFLTGPLGVVNPTGESLVLDAGGTCEGPTGACCDELTGTCTDAVLEADCQGVDLAWTRNVACADIKCNVKTRSICDSDPSDCIIDAGYGHSPADPAILYGIDAVELTFGNELCYPVDVSMMVPADFATRNVGGSLRPPRVASVTQTDMSTVTLGLSRPIPTRQWTCIRYLPGEAAGFEKYEVCLGSLPGDTNGDRTAAPGDILAAIDCLNGVSPDVNCPWGMYSADIDRSGEAGPADILGVIDLLNGAGQFDPMLNETIPAPCPYE